MAPAVSFGGSKVAHQAKRKKNKAKATNVYPPRQLNINKQSSEKINTLIFVHEVKNVLNGFSLRNKNTLSVGHTIDPL